MPDTAYRRLEPRFRRLFTLREAAAMLQWDGAALMPPGGAAARGDQLATLKLVCHEALTDPALGDLLDAAAGENDLDDWQRANLREMRREWLHATAVPGGISAAPSHCSMAAASRRVKRRRKRGSSRR